MEERRKLVELAELLGDNLTVPELLHLITFMQDLLYIKGVMEPVLTTKTA